MRAMHFEVPVYMNISVNLINIQNGSVWLKASNIFM